MRGACPQPPVLHRGGDKFQHICNELAEQVRAPGLSKVRKEAVHE